MIRMDELNELMEAYILTLDDYDTGGDELNPRDMSDCVLCAFYNWIKANEKDGSITIST